MAKYYLQHDDNGNITATLRTPKDTPIVKPRVVEISEADYKTIELGTKRYTYSIISGIQMTARQTLSLIVNGATKHDSGFLILTVAQPGITLDLFVRNEDRSLAAITETFYIPLMRRVDREVVDMLTIPIVAGTGQVTLSIAARGQYLFAMNSILPALDVLYAESPIIVVT